MRLIAATFALLLAVPAWGIVVECPDGTTWAGADLADCPCCPECPDGSHGLPGGICQEADREPALQPSTASAASEGPDAGAVLTGAQLALTLVLAVMYFLPALMARSRRHHQTQAIFALNLLLGWTVLGWIASLIWASTAVKATDDRGRIR